MQGLEVLKGTEDSLEAEAPQGTEVSAKALLMQVEVLKGIGASSSGREWDAMSVKVSAQL